MVGDSKIIVEVPFRQTNANINIDQFLKPSQLNHRRLYNDYSCDHNNSHNNRRSGKYQQTSVEWTINTTTNRAYRNSLNKIIILRFRAVCKSPPNFRILASAVSCFTSLHQQLIVTISKKHVPVCCVVCNPSADFI